MGNDIPYDVDAAKGPLAEIPIQWLLDDAPFFRHVYGATNAIADQDRVLALWKQEFKAMYEEYGSFVVTCHPWISGRAARMAMLDELIGYIKTFEGVLVCHPGRGGGLAHLAAPSGVTRFAFGKVVAPLGHHLMPVQCVPILSNGVSHRCCLREIDASLVG